MYDLKHQSSTLLDAPGYGYSSATKRRENSYKSLVKYYLMNSQRTCRIYWLSSLKHPFNLNDQIFFNFVKFCKLPITIIFTKADLFTGDEVLKRTLAYSHALKQFDIIDPFVYITSSKNKFGINELRKHMMFRFVLLF